MSVFAVLLVCTDNQCRSPAAAALLDAQLETTRHAASLSFDLASAGTHVTEPRALHPLTADALKEVGLVVPRHRSQPLSAELALAADLVLTAERAQREAVVDLAFPHDPSIARRTFTMLEFARATSVVEPLMDPTLGPAPMSLGRLMTPRELVAACVALRAHAPSTADDDLPDPAARPFVAHRDMVDSLAASIGIIGRTLASLAVQAR